MKNLLDLPNDIVFTIFQHLISTVEELIRLETVCKRIREICLSQRCWIDALETLENRPPFTTTRSSLLELSAADLRKEIVRAVKLDRSWKSEGGPLITEEVGIHHQNQTLPRYNRFLPLPEVDLMFTSHPMSGMYCWNISQKCLIWEHNVLHTNEMSLGLKEFDCDVADEHSTVLVALLFQRERNWYVQVHQLDARTFNCELLFESPPMSGTINGEIGVRFYDLRIRNHYVALSTHNRFTSKATLTFMNWKEKSFFRINNEPVSVKDYQFTEFADPKTAMLTSIIQNTKVGSSIALTQDVIFFICQVDTATIRLVGIRYGDLAGNSASISEDWPTFESVDLKDRGLYSYIILELERPPSDVVSSPFCQFSMTAVVTAWSKTPTTRITVFFNEMFNSTERSRISISDVAFTRNDNGHGLFKVIHLYSKVLISTTFLTMPSVAMRAVIQPFKTRRATTFSVIVNEDNGGIDETEKIHPLFHQSQAANAGGIDLCIQKSGMDPLGRMVVYQEESNQDIVIIRFD